MRVCWSGNRTLCVDLLSYGESCKEAKARLKVATPPDYSLAVTNERGAVLPECIAFPRNCIIDSWEAIRRWVIRNKWPESGRINTSHENLGRFSIYSMGKFFDIHSIEWICYNTKIKCYYLVKKNLKYIISYNTQCSSWHCWAFIYFMTFVSFVFDLKFSIDWTVLYFVMSILPMENAIKGENIHFSLGYFHQRFLQKVLHRENHWK